jgi:membrane-bound lytic murein transglycosylase D
MARLTYKNDPSTSFELTTGQSIIGRAEDCDIRIPDDYLSDHQCHIIFNGSQYVIKNLGETPLLVNGQRTSSHTLADQDEISLSDQKLIFYLSSERVKTHAPQKQTPILPKKARLISSKDPSVFYEIGDRDLYIGSGEDCDIHIADEYLSKRQCRIFTESGRAFIENLGQNPLVINGQPVKKYALRDLDEITISDARFVYHIEGATPKKTIGKKKTPTRKTPSSIPLPSDAEGILKEFGGSDIDEIRKRSLMIVRAFEKTQKKQRRKYTVIIAVIGVLAVAASAYAVIAHFKMIRQLALAESIFYNLKDLDVKLAQLPQTDIESSKKRRQMEHDYEKFLEDLGIYGGNLSPQDRVIYKMARIFGECEINIPPNFVQQVHNYIAQWQKSPRLREAVGRALSRGYHTMIGEEMLKHNLPPQFFYLALQESNFVPEVVGPKTNVGYAKGMWQFIPSTAMQYGLKTGPLQEYQKYDPLDERHDPEKSTRAAAKYLKYIYSTDAQASGLLVMASYNWGEGSVIKNIRKMDENPRDRNFWKLIKQYRIPDETYNYVYMIFSAAVIGENPRLFGFDFDNPLADVGRS